MNIKFVFCVGWYKGEPWTLIKAELLSLSGYYLSLVDIQFLKFVIQIGVDL